MALPKLLQPYLASYNLNKLDKNDPFAQKEIISQVLNSGDDRAVRWLFRTYPLKTIRSILRQPQKGTWFKDSLSYWQQILGVKTSSTRVQKAILKITPV